MKHRNPTTERLSSNFERFNPYAAKALEQDDNADVWAMLALAFEISQLRYQYAKRGNENNGRGSRHEPDTPTD